MNNHDINASALNGQASTQAQYVRTRIDAGAVLAVRPRVYARLQAPAGGMADVVGGGHVEFRSAGVVTAAAALVVDSTRNVRVGASITASALLGSVPHIRLRGPATVFGRAQLALRPRVVRGVVQAIGASATVLHKARAHARSPALVRAEALVGANGKVFPRRWIRSLLQMEAEASLTAALKGVVRASQLIVAEAQVIGGGGISNQFAYDEDAPVERTFVVAGEDNLFLVN